jgi:hypothetical protein
MLLNTVSKKDLIMKLFDLETPQTKKSQKVLEGYFGNSVDFTKLAPRATSNMLTKVRGLIYEHRTTTKMHNSEKDAGYMKLLVMERGLSARLREADIKLEPQTGATKITTSDGETIGSTNDQATAMQLQKDVKDGKITLGEEELVREAENWIKKATSKNPGAFKRQAKAAGMSTSAFANKVLSNKDDFNATTEKRANLAKTLGGMKESRNAGAILKKIAEGMTLRTKAGRYLSESEVQQAQVILAAQDMVDRMQGMLEDVTSMQFKDLPALSGSIQTTIGTTEAQAFNNAAGQSFGVLVDAIQAAKVEMEAAQGTLTGVEPVVPGQEEVAGVPMAGEPGADPLADPIAPVADVADVAVDAEAGGEAVDVNVDVQDAGLGRARR